MLSALTKKKKKFLAYIYQHKTSLFRLLLIFLVFEYSLIRSLHYFGCLLLVKIIVGNVDIAGIAFVYHVTKLQSCLGDITDKWWYSWKDQWIYLKRKKSDIRKLIWCKEEVGCLVLWHINLCRLFNSKSIFMQIVLFQIIQFSMSTQFNCQKHFYFKLFSLFKQF